MVEFNSMIQGYYNHRFYAENYEDFYQGFIILFLYRVLIRVQ
jgi:hypothetical protein